MKQKFNFALIVGVILVLNAYLTKADEPIADELTLRNQLFADVYLLKEGVDRLQISVEVLTKRYINQMDVLKDIQSKFITDNSEEKDDMCHKITGMFNSTYRKFNAFESRISTKLEEIQDDQSTRLDQILLKQKLNKNCGSQSASLANVEIMSTMLSEVNEKIDKFEEKSTKLESLEAKFNLQQDKLDKFVESQTKILQEINEKLTKNQQQFEKFEKELPNAQEIKNMINQMAPKTRTKLPMEVILGLTTANVTKFN